MIIHLSGEELPGAAFRAKRSRNAYVQYDSGDYPNDNLNLSSEVKIPVSRFEESDYPADVGEEHISSSTEDTETDCSESDSLESDSDDEMNALSGEIFFSSFVVYSALSSIQTYLNSVWGLVVTVMDCRSVVICCLNYAR